MLVKIILEKLRQYLRIILQGMNTFKCLFLTSTIGNALLNIRLKPDWD